MSLESHFSSRLELVLSKMQYYLQYFSVWYAETRSVVLSVWAFIGLSVRLCRRIVTESSLPREDDWDDIPNFDFGGETFLAISDFMRKSLFRNSASWMSRLWKMMVNAAKERSKKKSGTQQMTADVHFSERVFRLPCLFELLKKPRCAMVADTTVWLIKDGCRKT